MFYTANPLRTLRLCASALKSPNPSICQSPIPLYTFYMFYTAKTLCAPRALRALGAGLARTVDCGTPPA